MPSESAISKVIPANPGWFVCEPSFDDQGRPEKFCELEIIAWIIYYNPDGDGFTETLPVTPESLPGRYVLKSPSGRMFIPEAENFEYDQEAALKYMTL